jgi:hypothetical protein
MSFVPLDETGGEKLLKVVDNSLNTSNRESNLGVVLTEGASNVQYNPLVAVSASNNGATFNLNNIAPSTCRASKMWVNLPYISIALTLNNPSTSPVVAINSSNLGFKSRPYNSIVNSMTHKLNQASYNVQSNLLINEISRLNVSPDRENDDYNTQPDEIDTFSAATGSSLNPIESFSVVNQSPYNWKPRTQNIGLDTVNYPATSYTIPSGNTTIRLSASVYEELFSPFNNSFGGVQETQGLWAINGETITLNYATDLWSNMFAFYAINGCTVVGTPTVVLGSHILQLKYLTPLPYMLSTIPERQAYKYNDYNIYQNQIASSIAPKATTGNVASSVVSLSTIPERILVFCKESLASASSTKPNKYLTVNSMTVSFNNSNYNFSGASADDFYNISKRNGLSMSRSSFKGELLNDRVQVNGNLWGCGSVLVFKPSLDFALAQNLSTGTGGRYTMQIQATFTNTTDTTFSNVQLYIVAINAGALVRNGSEYMNYLLNVNENKLLEAKELPSVSQAVVDEEEKADGPEGGSVRKLLGRKLGLSMKQKLLGGIPLGGNPMGGTPLGGRMSKSRFY